MLTFYLFLEPFPLYHYLHFNENSYLFPSWLCAYMMQMNPLLGPELSNTTMLIMKREWGYADKSN